MAKKTLEYQLPEQDRLSLLQKTGGSARSLSAEQLAVIEKQRRAFIKEYSWDGLEAVDPDSKTFAEKLIDEGERSVA